MALLICPAFTTENGRPFFSAYSALMIVSIFQSVWDAKNYGMTDAAMFQTIGVVGVVLAATLIAGWAKPRWPQWMAAIGMLGLQFYFLITFMV